MRITRLSTLVSLSAMFSQNRLNPTAKGEKRQVSAESATCFRQWNAVYLSMMVATKWLGLMKETNRCAKYLFVTSVRSYLKINFSHFCHPKNVAK